MIDDLSISTVTRLPQTVTEHCDLVAAGTAFVGRKAATQKWWNTKERKEVGSDSVCSNTFRLTVARDVKALLGSRSHVNERLVLCFPISVVCGRGRVAREAREGCVFPNNYQLLRIAKRQGPQQNGVYNAEDRGVGADTECKRDQSDGCEARPLEQTANCVTDVLNNCFHDIISDSTRYQIGRAHVG